MERFELMEAAHDGKPKASLLSLCRAEVRSLLQLAVPLVAGLAGLTLLGPIDTFMLGPLGEVPLAAVSLTSSVLVIFYAALYGFLGPVGLLVGQCHGAHDPRRISGIVRHGLVLAVIAGIAGAATMALALLAIRHTGQPPEVIAIIGPYWLAMSLVLIPFCLLLVLKQLLDSIDRPWTSAAFMFVPAIVNVPLNWALINGHFGLPKLGLVGAGVASFISECAGVLALLVYFRLSAAMAPYRQAFRLNRHGIDEQTKEGLPMGFQYLLEAGSVAVVGVLIGWLGATALAANQIVFAVGSTLYMLPLGMSAAVGIRIAQASGEGAKNRIRAIGFSGVGLAVLWSAATTILLVVAGRGVAALFVQDPAVIALAALLFTTIGLMQVFDSVQSVSLGALRGLLDNQWPTRVSLVAYWLIALPMSLLLGFGLGWGAPGVWGGFGAGIAVAGAALLWRFSAQTADRN